MRPNIIFYFSDQQRWDTLGCYGQKLPVSPNLDAIASDGVVFENCFTCQPVCGPARACLQDGRYAAENGCFTNGLALDFSRKHLADYFNEAGYDTAYVGKWHLATNRPTDEMYEVTAIPEDRRAGYREWMAADVLEFTSHGYNGFVFDGDNKRHDWIGYRTDAINNYAIDVLHRHTGEKPLFMFISQIEPHHQNDHDCFEGPDGSRYRFSDFEAPADLPAGKGNWEKEFANYLGCCNALDENVGRFVAALKEKGMWDNTIFIYSSDHGSHFKTRNREYKRSCHDASIHVPLIIHGPGFGKNVRYDDLVSLIDIPPTLLEMAGIEVPSYYRGHSFNNLLEGRDYESQDEVFLQISESQIGRSIRTRDWLYSVRAEGDAWKEKEKDVYYEDFLYDMHADPAQMHNLASDPAYADVRASLAVVLKRRMVEAGEKEPVIKSWNEKPEDLKNDGYDYKHI